MTLKNCPRCGVDYMGERQARACPRCIAAQSPPGCTMRDVLLGKPLSWREKQLVEMIAEGCANKEIGYRLHICEGTVKVYLSRAYAKLGVEGRLHLAVFHLRNELEMLRVELAEARLTKAA